MNILWKLVHGIIVTIVYLGWCVVIHVVLYFYCQVFVYGFELVLLGSVKDGFVNGR